jgi:hypothetical protein
MFVEWQEHYLIPLTCDLCVETWKNYDILNPVPDTTEFVRCDNNGDRELVVTFHSIHFEVKLK